VLFSLRRKVWVLGDFGFSVEASSVNGRITKFALGTAGYAAPELLQDVATFSQRVDMWALGCVLHELATRSPAFHNIYAPLHYDRPSGTISINPFWDHLLSQVIWELLDRVPSLRPRSADIAAFFTSALRVLENRGLSITLKHATDKIHWRALQKAVCPIDRGQLVDDTPASQFQQFWILSIRNEAAESAQSIEETSALSLARTFRNIKDALGVFDYQSVTETLKDALNVDPADFWLQYVNCSVSMAQTGCKAALQALDESHSDSVYQLLLRRSLYALQGSYMKAIHAELELVNYEGAFDRIFSLCNSRVKNNLWARTYGTNTLEAGGRM
jgi:serine/threonine protein kinase